MPISAALFSAAMISSKLSVAGVPSVEAGVLLSLAEVPFEEGGPLPASGLRKDSVLLLDAITFMSGSRPASMNILPAQHTSHISTPAFAHERSFRR